MKHPDLHPDVALIHGWGIGKAVWQPVIEALSRHCRVHLLELPGYGALPANTDGFAATAQRLVDALPKDITLCGWSLGAMLALQAALLEPQRIDRLVLVGSTPSFTQRDHWPDAQEPALLATFTTAIAENADAALQRFVALLNQGDTQSRGLGRAMIRPLQASPLPDTDTLRQGLGWLRDVDLREQIASVAVPTLLIHGENDPLMPLAAALWLKEHLPDAQLELFGGAAHAPFLNDVQRFAKLIGDFTHVSAINQAAHPRVV